MAAKKTKDVVKEETTPLVEETPEVEVEEVESEEVWDEPEDDEDLNVDPEPTPEPEPRNDLLESPGEVIPTIADKAAGLA